MRINLSFHLVESCKSCLKVFWFDLEMKLAASQNDELTERQV